MLEPLLGLLPPKELRLHKEGLNLTPLCQWQEESGRGPWLGGSPDLILDLSNNLDGAFTPPSFGTQEVLFYHLP